MNESIDDDNDSKGETSNIHCRSENNTYHLDGITTLDQVKLCSKSIPLLYPALPKSNDLVAISCLYTCLTQRPAVHLYPTDALSKICSLPLNANTHFSPALTPHLSRCCARIVRGNQCKREFLSSDDSGQPRYCRDHKNQALGFISAKTNKWIKYSEYIKDYLQPKTREALKLEMRKGPSKADEPGYIYMLEYPNIDDSHVKIKVGRSSNPKRRLSQWKNLCGSKAVWRICYPGMIVEDERAIMGGRMVPNGIGPWCHRVERLVLLEINDLTETKVYLKANWEKVHTEMNHESVTVKAKIVCSDCRRVHKELFDFFLGSGGKLGSMETCDIMEMVRDVIVKWSKFVKENIA